MKKHAVKILAWVLVLAAIPCAVLAYDSLRFREESGAYAPDESWCGVLRVWAASDLCGSGAGIIRWLNARAETFEKRNEGIRVQILDVEPETLAAYAQAQNPPDAIVFPAGIFDSAEGLTEIDIDCNYMKGLTETGMAGGARYAAPIAIGTYFWVVNTDVMRCVPGTNACPETYRLQIPKDDHARSWSGALLALFSGVYESGEERVVLPGADLGLPEAESEKQTNDVTGSPYQPPKTPSEGFRESESVLSLFTSGEADAICATQAELKRLETMADSGRAPDYVVFAGGAAFTDQIALAAIPDVQRDRADERKQLAQAFVQSLVSEDSQAALTSAHVFRATKGPSLYAAYRAGMAAAEASLENGVIAAPAFGSAWRDAAKRAVDRYFIEGGDPGDMLHDALHKAS